MNDKPASTPDETARMERIEAKKLYYQEHLELRKATFELQGLYGRWLIASLLLVHGGSLLFLSRELGADGMRGVYLWHVAGIVLALATGFASWFNGDRFIHRYREVSVWMIYDDNIRTIAEPVGQQRPLDLTLRVSLTCGVLSTVCIVAAAVAAYNIVGTPTPA